jgi:hypothetical protein
MSDVGEDGIGGSDRPVVTTSSSVRPVKRGGRARSIGRPTAAVLLGTLLLIVPFMGACSGQRGEAIRSSLSGGSLPTQRPTTEAPTSEPTEPPTSEPTEPPTSEPTEPPTTEPTQPPTTVTVTVKPTVVQPTTPAASESSGVSPWLWVAIAAAVVLIVALIGLARVSRRKRTEWEGRARDAYATGVALHDRLAADLVSGDRAVFGPARIGEVTGLADRVSTQFRSIGLDAPDAPDGPKSRALADVNRDLEALRSAIELQARATSTGVAQEGGTPSATLQVRLEDFERSLRGFRGAVWPGQG